MYDVQTPRGLDVGNLPNHRESHPGGMCERCSLWNTLEGALLRSETLSKELSTTFRVNFRKINLCNDMCFLEVRKFGLANQRRDMLNKLIYGPPETI